MNPITTHTQTLLAITTNRRSACVHWAISLCTLLLFAAIACAQSTSGNMVGTVYDNTGAVVQDASVTATNTATLVPAQTKTTSSGQYRLANLPVGNYSLSVTAPGFGESRVGHLTIQLNQTVTANVSLEIQKASTSVVVTESAAAIDTTTAQVQTTFDRKQLQDLPTTASGSGVVNLSLLNAGVASSGGVGFGNGPSVGGQRPANNNFTVEGIDDNDKGTTGPLVTVPNDAVAEFSVLQNQFSPDFGHSSGGQFNQVVKSGTNEFHGMLYEYIDNRNFDAGDNLNAVQNNPLHPRYDNNRFGGTLGGPIRRNKMFFFVNWEYQNVGQTASSAFYAPTQAGYGTLAGIPGINQTNLSIFKKYLGTASTAAAPATLPFGGAVTVGPGNASLGTQATSTPVDVGQISVSLPNFVNYDNAVAAFDYNISTRDSFRARYVANRNGPIDYQGYPATFFTITPFNTYLIALSEYHTFTPSLTNEFRLGYNRYFNDTPIGGKESFPGLDQFPNINIYELNVGLGPDGNAPQFTVQNTYQLANNLSWTRGNHSFKFGFDGWKSISPQSFTQRSRGDYEWSFLSDYLFDNNPDVIAQRGLGNVIYYGDQVMLAFYGNDTWKIRPNLSLNLGLRYEYQTVPYSERLQSVNSISNVPGLISFGEPKPQKTNFMPRIGVAYSPGVDGKTSIRAGFGINYDVLYDNLGVLSLPPQFSRTVDVTGFDQTGFLANGGIPGNVALGSLTQAQARFNTGGYIPDQKRPESIQWNFGIQHVFHQDYTAEVRYLGTRGLFLPFQQRLNFQSVVNAQNALPMYYSQPSQAALDALPNTLDALQTAYGNGGAVVPAFAAAGFNNPSSPVTAFLPIGNSTYHGLATQLTRRFTNGLQFIGAYTWSHNIDDSTAATASTVFTPRRAQDSQNLRVERASSALDHRQRLSYEVLYDVPFFKNRNWFLKNLAGNWEIAPIYTYQTGTLVTPQSAVDSNLNGDSAADRVFINPNGTANTGSGATPLTNSSNQVVAYVATDPTAKYVLAPRGTLPNAGRNLIHLNPINNVDLTAVKRFSVTERFHLEFAARLTNALNHPQYTGGYLSDVLWTNYGPNSAEGLLARSSFEPNSTAFQKWDQAFSSNPRNIILSLKLTF